MYDSYHSRTTPFLIRKHLFRSSSLQTKVLSLFVFDAVHLKERQPSEFTNFAQRKHVKRAKYLPPFGHWSRPTCARCSNLPTPILPAVDTRQEYFNILERSSGIAVLACEVDTTSGSIQFDATAETLETRPLGELSSTAEILKENKRSEVYAQCNYCHKRTRFGSYFCRCGKKLALPIDRVTRQERSNNT